MATSKIQIDEGSTTNLATSTISEDAVTKHLNRSILNKSDGSEFGIVSNPIFVQATFATIPVVGNFVPAGGTLSVYQGAGTAAWRTTLATLPVITNVTGYALESGGNLDAIITTLNSIKSKTDNLDVTLGSRLGSGATLSITGSITAFNAGGSLTAFQGGNPWLITAPTLPVVAGQGGIWTVQPGNTPNTTAWLTTQATLPVVVGGSVTALNAGGSISAFQGGIWNVFSSLASGTNMIAGGQYLPTLASLSTLGYNPIPLDLFGNLRVNPNTALPNSTRFNRFLTFASYASIMAAPGAGRRLVIREMDFSGNATLTVELYEDHAGTPARVWGPHYFLPYSGFIKPTCYVPITANKSLGINITGSAFNSTLDIRIETENV